MKNKLSALFLSLFIFGCHQKQAPVKVQNLVESEEITRVSSKDDINEKKEEEKEPSFVFTFNESLKDFRQNVDEKWNIKYAVSSNNKIIKYLNNYSSRVIIDYDKKQVKIDVKSKEELKNVVDTAFLLSLNRNTDLFSSSFSKGPGPYLLEGLIEKPSDISKTIFINNSGKSYYRLEIPFMNIDLQKVLAAKSENMIATYAKKTKLSKQFLMIMAKLASSYNSLLFNDKEYRFGLFQIGENEIVTEKNKNVSYNDLLDLEGNVDYATKYFLNLKKGSLKRIYDKDAMEYSLICAYVMGEDNYLKLFSRNKQQAVSIINSINSDRFYNELLRRVPNNVKEFLESYKQNI